MANKPIRTRKDWAIIRTQFVEGEETGDSGLKWPTLRELSDRHGIAYDYVRKKASKGDWSAAQEAYKDEYEVRLAKERLKQRIKRIQDFERDYAQVSDQGLTHIKIHFNAFAKRNQGNTNPSPMELRELEALSRAAERFQKIGCVALGVPDSTTSMVGPAKPREFRWVEDGDSGATDPGKDSEV
jgi:hypothetical protein